MIDLEFVSSLFSVISILGLLANSLSVYTVFGCKHLHNTFGALCVVLAISNLGVLLIFLFWCAYGSYLCVDKCDKRKTYGHRFDDSIRNGVAGKFVGQIGLFFLDVKMYGHLGVSINRLFSLMNPMKYHAMEARARVTIFYISAATFFAFLQVTPLFWTDEFYFVYYSDIAVWDYSKTTGGRFYYLYMDFLLSVCIFCIILFLDAIAVYTLRKALDISQYSETMKQKRKIEIGFFVQSLCQMVPSLFVYVSFTFLSRYATTDWELFITTTLVWVLLHAVDGVIMDVFQARKVLIRNKTKTITVSSMNGSALMNTMWTENHQTVV